MICDEIKEPLLQRFLKYARTYSESSGENADKGIMPSTPQQWDMAQVLLSELQSLGLENTMTTKSCYTYGILPATKGQENSEGFCLLAHIDTVDEVSGKDVNPQIHKNYDGTKITLKENIVLDPEEDKMLQLAGQNRETVITSDGTTLLGADDKAGVASIMTALEYLSSHPEISHPDIEVIFSPDEETGHGMDKVPMDMLKSKCAYTVDGGHMGELEVECFNASKAEVHFEGAATHTGTARGKMVNAVVMASSFVSSLPRHLMPETTDNYTGFYAPMEIEGTIENSKVTLLLRDFDEKKLEEKKQVVDTIANAVAVTFGGKTRVCHTDQYKNMKSKLDQHPEVTSNLVKAYEKAGIKPEFTPIRGGTDGSRLTEMGIPTPNIFTGGHNFHSRKEWASLEQMSKSCEILIHLATL